VLAVAVALVVAACGSSGSSVGPTGSAGRTTPGTSSTGTFGPPAGSPAPGGAGSGGAGTAAALALQRAYESVVANVSPSVVVIETNQGLGSGIVFDDQGDIVTNAHVVAGAASFRVTTAAGDQLDASLVGSFVPDDLAVIKVSDGKLQPATFGDSSKLVVGEIVLALGNPLGLQSSVTSGIISALGRTVNEPAGTALPGVIQTSASINPGNSGGALVDLDGQVVGIPTLTATDPQLGGAAPGIGFAIPSNMAKDIAGQLIRNGHVTNSHRAYLGIQGATVTGANGVLVYSEEPGGPAARAGIPTDVLITSIDGQPVPDLASLTAVLANLSPGQQVDVVYEQRDGTQRTVKVTLGQLSG
jgi:putative serine protease PepD